MDKEDIRSLIIDAGAIKVGFAVAEDVDACVMSQFREWIAADQHAGMDYLRRHIEIKGNPDSVLPGTKTVISVAFSYVPEKFRDSRLPMISCYAYGDDYHDVIRGRLKPVVAQLQSVLGGDWRICIDSAPVAERYWAVKSGVGFRGYNGSVIVDGAGCYAFLAEIMTTVAFAPDESCEGVKCKNCGACSIVCPQGALSGDGMVDSRLCLNYLTIEHRGDWKGVEEVAMSTSSAHDTLFGCDRCQRYCPHNKGVSPTHIEEFRPRATVMAIDADAAIAMTKEEFSRQFKGSAIKRVKFEGWQRNANHLSPSPPLA